MILYINACVRHESRTERLARHLLVKLGAPFTEVRLSEIAFPVADESFLQKRDALIRASAWEDPLFSHARQFAAADEIVISAPFWDLSFPAALKQYFEQINVLGVTFRYTPQGNPEGLCRAKRLFYVTTAGGNFFPTDYGFGYVKSLATAFYGIPSVELISATGLDVDGADREQILQNGMREIDRLVP